jgi:hypothetical protein
MSPLWGTALVTNKKVTELTIRYSCGLKTVVSAAFGSVERLGQLAGFQPSNWIPALYEVIPYSFLIDYVSNVGDIIEAACTSQANVTWVNRSSLNKTTQEYYTRCDRASTFAVWRGNNFAVTDYIEPEQGMGHVKFARVTYSRTPQDSLGIPPLVLESPLGDTKKILNVLALLRGRFFG